MTGLWVLGHECGHGAFSTSDALNDVVGYVLHSALLVPYFSWKISHRKHHKATNNLSKDMGFVPNTKDHFLRNRHLSTIAELSDETPLYTMFSLLQLQSTGWLVYLLTNATSHNQHERQKEGRGIGKSDGFLHGVNHFNSNSPIFDDKDKDKVHASNIGLLATLAILMAVAYGYGWKLVAIHYFAPYILLNNWIILITSMQHSDPSVPHYSPQSWNWSRGSAATIDRDFGFIGRFFFHSIIETHVLHHHVSTIPFYNAAEASEAMKRVLGRHYRSDTRGGIVGYFKAMWMRIRLYHWVEPTSMKYQGVLFYKKRNSL
ncbi:related to oleate delta-12 desaturase [Rhynchosporium graminicola]|uniref:Related to oleate delta-12 desaturase n=1 Tax=Rhynchosporium graminicola TaxID=2792576 RepID=A0A1E1KJI3_9HELO|nr:related to oleate delta-12 desaturase [Rhynchosporium commune]